MGIKGTPRVYATRCRVVPDVDGVFQIAMLNVNAGPVALNSRKYVGNLNVPTQVVAQVHPDKDKNSQAFEANIVYGDNLSLNERKELISMITKFKDVFASNPKKPSLVQNMEHRIITEDAQPTRQKPRRIPQAWNKEVNEQVQEMLDNEIIRPSSSPWNAPILMVKKKDNSMRFVCDFCGLNDVTKKIRTPYHTFAMLLIKWKGPCFGPLLMQRQHIGLCHSRKVIRKKQPFQSPEESLNSMLLLSVCVTQERPIKE